MFVISCTKDIHLSTRVIIRTRGKLPHAVHARSILVPPVVLIHPDHCPHHRFLGCVLDGDAILELAGWVLVGMNKSSVVVVELYDLTAFLIFLKFYHMRHDRFSVALHFKLSLGHMFPYILHNGGPSCVTHVRNSSRIGSTVETKR